MTTEDTAADKSRRAFLTAAAAMAAPNVVRAQDGIVPKFQSA